MLPIAIAEASAQVCSKMLDPEASRPGEETRNHRERPHILVGVTSPQTCLVLSGRVRALREAGFRVSLLSAPGDSTGQTARSEQVDAYAIPMERGISFFADMRCLCSNLAPVAPSQARHCRVQYAKGGLLGTLAAFVCRIPARIYFLRGLRLETAQGLKRCLLLWTERIASLLRPLRGVQQPESARAGAGAWHCAGLEACGSGRRKQQWS